MSVFVHVVTHQQVCRHMDTCTPIERRKRLHAYVHAWLRLCLQLPEHQELVIAHSPTGKPYLRDFPHWQFNLSHSKQHLALVCGQTQHPLGIDIESHPRTIRPAVIKASLSATELSHYHQAAEPLRYWLQVWTLKEAVLKAAGCGIVQDLHLLDSGFTGHNESGHMVFEAQPYAYQCLHHLDYHCAVAWQNDTSLPELQWRAPQA